MADETVRLDAETRQAQSAFGSLREGVDALEESLKGVAAVGDKLSESFDKAEEALARLEKSEERFRADVQATVEAIEGTSESLSRRSNVLAQSINLVEQDGIVSKQAAESIKAELRDLLELYERLGQKAPESIQALTDKYKALDIEQEKAAETVPKVTAATDQVATSADKAGVSIKGLTKNIGAGISLVSILRQNLQDLAPVVDGIESSFRDWAKANELTESSANAVVEKVKAFFNPGNIVKSIIADIAVAQEKWNDEIARFADAEIPKQTAAMEAQAAAMQTLLDLQEKRKDAVKNEATERQNLAVVLTREYTEQAKSGEITNRTREDIEKLNQAYADAGEEAPKALQNIVSTLGILTTEQAKAKAEAEDHGAKAAAAAEKRAASEEAAAERTKVALEKETAARREAIETTEAAMNAAVARAEAPESGANALAEAEAGAASLAEQVKSLESQLMLTPEQQNQLDTLKNQLADANLATQELSRSGADLTGAQYDEVEAAEVLAATYEHLEAVQADLTAGHEAALDSLEMLEGGYSQLENSTEDWLSSVDQVDDVPGLFSAAESSVGRMQDALSDATGGAEDFTETAEDASETMDDLADSAEKAAKETKKIGEDGAEGIEDLATNLGTAEEIMDRLIEKGRTLVSVLNQAAEAV